MKKFITITMGALVAFTVAATSITSPAYAGKKERRTAAGIIIGAIGGAIIAGEISRSRKKRRAHHARRYYNDNNNYNRPRRYRRPRVSHDRYYNEPRIQRHRYYDDAPEVVYERPRYQRRRYQRRAYAAPRLSRYERHVKRCYASYRTYDKRSDTFIGYDGNEHKCRK